MYMYIYICTEIRKSGYKFCIRDFFRLSLISFVFFFFLFDNHVSSARQLFNINNNRGMGCRVVLFDDSLRDLETRFERFFLFFSLFSFFFKRNIDYA